jgi:hypothetical protein
MTSCAVGSRSRRWHRRKKDQIAAFLKIGTDVLYFWAKRVPPDLEPTENIDPGRIAAAYQAFRRALKSEGKRAANRV